MKNFYLLFSILLEMKYLQIQFDLYFHHYPHPNLMMQILLLYHYNMELCLYFLHLNHHYHKLRLQFEFEAVRCWATRWWQQTNKGYAAACLVCAVCRVGLTRRARHDPANRGHRGRLGKPEHIDGRRRRHPMDGRPAGHRRLPAAPMRHGQRRTKCPTSSA